MDANIGDRILEVMNLVKLNQKSFAKKINITDTSLRKWTNGEVDPRYAHLVRIVEEFPEINALWLFTGEGNMEKIRNISYRPERKSHMILNDKQKKYEPNICSDCPFKSLLENFEKQLKELQEQIDQITKT